MFAFIEGDIVHKSQDYLVVDTGGVGYRIHVSPGMMPKFASVGETQRIHTYLSVREDAMVLYGFPGRDELAMFEMLITVSGIGPKVASAIVADISPSRFAMAVVSDDSVTLTSAKGLGKKGAQRIILELKDKIGKDFAGSDTTITIPQISHSEGDTDTLADAVSALMVLGYPAQQATQMVQQVLASHDESVSLEFVIKAALTRLI